MPIFEPKQTELEYDAPTAGFVVVRLQAGPSNRTVIAHGYVDGDLVASASAADNHASNVISSTTQCFTMPVPKGSRYKVMTVAGTGVEVRWFPA